MGVTFFCKFFTNPTIDTSNLTAPLESQWKADFSDTLSVQTHTSQIHFCFKHTVKNTIETSGRFRGKKPLKPPLPIEAPECPSNSWLPKPTPLTTPNDSSIGSPTSTQLCIKLPIGYNGMPPNLPLKRSLPHLIHPSLDRPHSHPTQHPDPISHFATIHFPDRHTDGIDDSLTPLMLTLAILIESDVLIITKDHYCLYSCDAA